MNKSGKTNRSTAFILLGIGVLLIALFGNQLGLFSIGQKTSSTISGSWTNWQQIDDYSTYPNRNLETSACASTESFATIRYIVPNETQILSTNIIGKWNMLYSNTRGDADIILSCRGTTLITDESVGINESISVDIPKSCVYWDSLNNNYKVGLEIIGADNICIADEKVIFRECDNTEKCSGTIYYSCENYLWKNNNRVLGKCGVECLSSDTKCVGTNYYTCSSYKWSNQNKIVGKCGIECLSGNKCVGTIYNLCTNNVWVSQGQVNGHCGYSTSGNTSIICSSTDTKCEGTTSYSCSNNAWVSQGQVNGKCGFAGTQITCSDGIKNGDETGIDCGGSCAACGTSDGTFSLNDTFIKIGDFNITWLMLLIALAIIVLFIVIK